LGSDALLVSVVVMRLTAGMSATAAMGSGCVRCARHGMPRAISLMVYSIDSGEYRDE
jgi:hypothetical protein